MNLGSVAAPIKMFFQKGMNSEQSLLRIQKRGKEKSCSQTNYNGWDQLKNGKYKKRKKRCWLVSMNNREFNESDATEWRRCLFLFFLNGKTTTTLAKGPVSGQKKPDTHIHTHTHTHELLEQKTRGENRKEKDCKNV